MTVFHQAEPPSAPHKTVLMSFFKEAAGLLAFNALLWWLIPGLFLGNLLLECLFNFLVFVQHESALDIDKTD